MSLLKNYYKDNPREIDAITNKAEMLQIATSPRLYLNRQLVWAYEITAEVDGKLLLVESESGLTKLCSCRECLKFGAELAEFYSVYMALASAKGRFPKLERHLWFYSEKLKYDLEECLFSYYKDIYQCGFLVLLGDRLSALIYGNLNPRFIEVDKNIPF